MKTKLILTLSALSLMNAVFSQPIQAEGNQCLGEICMYMKESQVRDSLGKPLSSNQRTCGRRDLSYSKGEVSFHDGATYRIATQSRRWRTAAGIKVGDNISKAQKKYHLKKDDLSSFHVELSTGNYLTFYTDNYQKISKIELLRITVC